MIKLLFGRLLATVPVLLGVTFVVFVAMHLAPGDVARTILGFGATEERVEALRAELGLDRPIIVQYAIWLGNLLRGDLGQSIALGVPVSDVILDKIGASLLLMAASFVLAATGGLLFAALSGGAHRTIRDRIITVLTLICASLPPFWIGLVLLYVFAYQLKMFPSTGMYSVVNPGGWLDVAHHLVLPTITTTLSSMAVVARVTRGSFIDIMNSPFIFAARAHGATRGRLVRVEALRNVLPIFVTISGLQIGYLFGSVIFSEIVFNWPGIGLQLYQAIIQRDYPVVQGCTLAIAVVFVFGNLTADLIVHMLDPRKR